jgi:hypothetical protein
VVGLVFWLPAAHRQRAHIGAGHGAARVNVNRLHSRRRGADGLRPYAPH